MNLAIQAFKYAAEPFFYSKAEDKNAPSVFADVMKWFIVICATMWVGICLNLHLLADLFLKKKIFHEGLAVVPWLLMGFLFLGIYYNLATWFKLIQQNAIWYLHHIDRCLYHHCVEYPACSRYWISGLRYCVCRIRTCNDDFMLLLRPKILSNPLSLKICACITFLEEDVFILLDAFLIPSGSISNIDLPYAFLCRVLSYCCFLQNAKPYRYVFKKSLASNNYQQLFSFAASRNNLLAKINSFSSGTVVLVMSELTPSHNLSP